MGYMHIYIYMCVYICVYIYNCVCMYTDNVCAFVIYIYITDIIDHDILYRNFKICYLWFCTEAI